MHHATRALSEEIDSGADTMFSSQVATWSIHVRLGYFSYIAIPKMHR